MIMKRHNPAFNYYNAVGSKDRNYMKDLVLNDISDVIITNKPMVISGLKHAGVPIEATASNKQVAIAVADNLGTNAQLTKNVSKLVALKHSTGSRPRPNIPVAPSRMNAIGDGGFKLPEGFLSKSPDSSINPSELGSGGGGGKTDVGAIAGAIGKVFEFGTTVVGNKQQQKIQQEATKQSLINMISAKIGTKPNTTKTIIIAGTVLVGLTIAGLLYWKLKK